MRAAIFFWTFCLSLQAVSAVGGRASLPQGVKERLDAQYPGWDLALVSREVWERFERSRPGHHPCAVAADFDGDGQPDYAIQIALMSPDDEEQIVTVFLGREGGYEEAIVESRGPDPRIYLWTDRQAFTEMVEGREREFSRQRLLVRGSAIGDSAYLWQGGQFREVPFQMSDREDDPRSDGEAPEEWPVAP